MFLLPCGECQQSFPVAPSRAGDTVTCPHCSAAVVVPKLGELRQLPRADASPGDDGAASRSERTGGASGLRILGALLIAAAGIGLIASSYCLFRWYRVPVQQTTLQHVEATRETFEKMPAEQLVQYWNMAREVQLLGNNPFEYQKELDLKQAWLNGAMGSGIPAILGLLIAFVLLLLGGKKTAKT